MAYVTNWFLRYGALSPQTENEFSTSQRQAVTNLRTVIQFMERKGYPFTDLALFKMPLKKLENPHTSTLKKSIADYRWATEENKNREEDFSKSFLRMLAAASANNDEEFKKHFKDYQKTISSNFIYELVHNDSARLILAALVILVGLIAYHLNATQQEPQRTNSFRPR